MQPRAQPPILCTDIKGHFERKRLFSKDRILNRQTESDAPMVVVWRKGGANWEAKAAFTATGEREYMMRSCATLSDCFPFLVV